MHFNLAVSMKYLTEGSAQLLTQLKCIKYTVRIDAEDIVRLRSCFLCRLQKAFLPYQPGLSSSDLYLHICSGTLEPADDSECTNAPPNCSHSSVVHLSYF